jgi:hypothetical protein
VWVETNPLVLAPWSCEELGPHRAGGSAMAVFADLRTLFLLELFAAFGVNERPESLLPQGGGHDPPHAEGLYVLYRYYRYYTYYVCIINVLCG